MKKTITIGLMTMSMILLSFQISFSQQQKGDTIRVLFVGNSFTYFYNLPQVVSAMAATQHQVIITRQSTVGGSNLEQHWKKQRGTRTMNLLDSTSWDYVVFNNHSTSAIDSPEAFNEYGNKFSNLVKAKGGQPIFMMTWAYKSDSSMHTPIREGYLALGKQTGADVVPCGELFEKARTQRPELEMYFDDKHPSSNATYMLGLAFYKYFTKAPVDKIPVRITTRDKDDELTYLIFMHDDDATFLKKIVTELDF